MKGDLPAAALRIMSRATVHTHVRQLVMPPTPQGSKYGRAIVINGVKYPSMHDAKKKLKVCNATIYGWLATGRAARCL